MLKDKFKLFSDWTKNIDDNNHAIIFAFAALACVLGIIQVGVGIVSGRYLEYAIDGGIWIGIAVLSEVLKSRIAAVIIFIAILVNGVVVFLIQFTPPMPNEIPKAPGDIDNMPYMWLMAIIAAYKMMRATFRYRAFKKLALTERPPIIKQ